MKILIDTHIFLWAVTEDPRLSKPHRAIYLSKGSDLYLSVASIWEMIVKAGLGKLPLPSPASAWISKQMDMNRILALPILPSHVAELETLPPIHRDPFDRMLAAQARYEKMPLLTADPMMRKYGAKIL
jgi:PIN domain nuclease of toxin-antitoxin system